MLTIGTIKSFNVTEVSQLLQISEKTVRDYCAQSRIKAQKIGRNWFITEAALEEFLQGTPPKEETAEEVKTEQAQATETI